MRKLLSRFLLTLYKKVNSECFATPNAIVTAEASHDLPLFTFFDEEDYNEQYKDL